MDRSNAGRYTYIRRQGQSQQQQHQSSSSLSSSSSSSASSTSNNNQHLDNYRNSLASSSTSQQFPSSNNTSPYTSQAAMPREPLTQHDELIRYIREAWTNVSEQGTPVMYRHESDQLKNFKPFNLEEYWGQRLVQNIHVSHGHQ